MRKMGYVTNGVDKCDIPNGTALNNGGCDDDGDQRTFRIIKIIQEPILGVGIYLLIWSVKKDIPTKTDW